MKDSDSKAMYLRFLAMIATSMAVMFALMYLNSYRILDHARFSETRAYMTLIMGGAMVVVMLAYMLGMYANTKWNVALFAAGGLMLLMGVARTEADAAARPVPEFDASIQTGTR